MIGMMFFIGWVFTLAWVPRLADMYGRKKPYLIGMTLNIFVAVGIMFGRSLNTIIVLSFLTGCLNSFRVQVAFIYMMEMMPQDNQALFTALYCALDVTTPILFVIYYSQLSNNSISLMAVGILLNIINVVTCSRLPESPRFLVAQQRLEEAADCFEQIARWNRKKESFYFSKGFFKYVPAN